MLWNEHFTKIDVGELYHSHQHKHYPRHDHTYDAIEHKVRLVLFKPLPTRLLRLCFQSRIDIQPLCVIGLIFGVLPPFADALFIVAVLVEHLLDAVTGKGGGERGRSVDHTSNAGRLCRCFEGIQADVDGGWNDHGWIGSVKRGGDVNNAGAT